MDQGRPPRKLNTYYDVLTAGADKLSSKKEDEESHLAIKSKVPDGTYFSRDKKSVDNTINQLDSSVHQKIQRGHAVSTSRKRTTTTKAIIQAHRDSNGVEHQSSCGPLRITVAEEQLCNLILHRSGYREYCDQALSQEIDSAVEQLLVELLRLQDRAHARSRDYDQQALQSQKRRLIFGLNEVSKFISLPVRRVKAVIIAPDIEGSISTDPNSNGIPAKERTKSLEGLLQTIKTGCAQQDGGSCRPTLKAAPVIFALDRRRMRNICHKRGNISAIAILNYDGANALFSTICDLVGCSRDKYTRMSTQLFMDLVALGDEEKSQLLARLSADPAYKSHLKHYISSSTGQTLNLLSYRDTLDPSDRRKAITSAEHITWKSPSSSAS